MRKNHKGHHKINTHIKTYDNPFIHKGKTFYPPSTVSSAASGRVVSSFVLFVAMVSTTINGSTFGLVDKNASNFEKNFHSFLLPVPDLRFLSFSVLYFCLNFLTLLTTSRAVNPSQWPFVCS